MLDAHFRSASLLILSTFASHKAPQSPSKVESELKRSALYGNNKKNVMHLQASSDEVYVRSGREERIH
jgi:hypothetical protein